MTDKKNDQPVLTNKVFETLRSLPIADIDAFVEKARRVHARKHSLIDYMNNIAEHCDNVWKKNPATTLEIEQIADLILLYSTDDDFKVSQKIFNFFMLYKGEKLVKKFAPSGE